MRYEIVGNGYRKKFSEKEISEIMEARKRMRSRLICSELTVKEGGTCDCARLDVFCPLEKNSDLRARDNQY